MGKTKNTYTVKIKEQQRFHSYPTIEAWNIFSRIMASAMIHFTLTPTAHKELINIFKKCYPIQYIYFCRYCFTAIRNRAKSKLLDMRDLHIRFNSYSNTHIVSKYTFSSAYKSFLATPDSFPPLEIPAKIHPHVAIQTFSTVHADVIQYILLHKSGKDQLCTVHEYFGGNTLVAFCKFFRQRFLSLIQNSDKDDVLNHCIIYDCKSNLYSVIDATVDSFFQQYQILNDINE